MHATQREPGNRHLKSLGLTKSVVARAYILTLGLLDNQTLLRGLFHGLASWQERADIRVEDSLPNTTQTHPTRNAACSTQLTSQLFRSTPSDPALDEGERSDCAAAPTSRVYRWHGRLL